MQSFFCILKLLLIWLFRNIPFAVFLIRFQAVLSIWF